MEKPKYIRKWLENLLDRNPMVLTSVIKEWLDDFAEHHNLKIKQVLDKITAVPLIMDMMTEGRSGTGLFAQ